MQKKRILILGGGISGLTLAYYLSRKKDLFDIHLIEQSNRMGGWIDSDATTGFFFEKGPRIFPGSRSAAFLSLAKDIGMENELIESNPDGHGRYLWKNGKLRKVPMLSWGLVQGLMRDLRVKPSLEEDESVWDFACRRFNEKVAADFFDPMVVGIYGGGVREASMKSCFPRFWKWEQEHGSVIRGVFKSPRHKGPRMFSFRRGLKSVIQKLEEVTPVHFHREEKVIELKALENGFEVKTSEGHYTADYVFSALPCHAIGKLLIPQLLNVPMRGTTIVNLGYHQKVLKKNGFGYLVGSGEGDEVLGVIFDSVAFPQFNHGSQETRLTVMLKSDDLSDGEARDLALKALKNHLGISHPPTVSNVTRAPKVFPQMNVGHDKMMKNLEETMRQKYPRLQLVGNYLQGVGVNDCIERAKSVSENFLREVAN
jgi:protoporphyrinogen/coproporphyrinogen III oxidase